MVAYAFDLGSLLGLAIATAGGWWAVRRYLESRRADRAEWLHRIFSDFYLRPEPRAMRKALEYCDPELTRLVERRVSRRDISVSESEADLLCSLDTILNHFEFLCYLEQTKQIRIQDRDAIFKYWLDVLALPQNAGLRRYIDKFGFERTYAALPGRVIRDTVLAGAEYVVFYGSLMREGGKQAEACVEESLTLVKSCQIPGVLYDLGDYPGLVEGDGLVQGELYRLDDHKVFKLLDNFERYDPVNPGTSLFVRRCVWVPTAQTDCWAYFYNGPVGNARLVESGNWLQYIRSRGSGTCIPQTTG